MAKKTLWTMDIHDTITVDDMEVTRVPGGWVYRSINRHYQNSATIGGSEAAVFVPYIKEESRYD